MFLLYDDDRNRSLDRFEMARFLARFSVLSGEPFDQLAGRLVSLLEADDVLGSADMQELALLNTQPDMQVWGGDGLCMYVFVWSSSRRLCVLLLNTQQGVVPSPPSYHHHPTTQLQTTLERRKLEYIFELLDDNGDGLVDAAALQTRLRALLGAARISPQGRRAADACMERELLVNEYEEHDEEDNWGSGWNAGGDVTQLTPRRFVGVVALVADAAGLQLSEVCDWGSGCCLHTVCTHVHVHHRLQMRCWCCLVMVVHRTTHVWGKPHMCEGGAVCCKVAVLHVCVADVCCCVSCMCVCCWCLYTRCPW